MVWVSMDGTGRGMGVREVPQSAQYRLVGGFSA